MSQAEPAPRAAHDNDVAALARGILDLEREMSEGPASEAPARDGDWFELAIALWRKLKSGDATRRSLRLPAHSIVQLAADGRTTSARVLDVSHVGLRISGALSALRPGFSVTWAKATAGEEVFSMQVPCHVIWCERDPEGGFVAGLQYRGSDRAAWGRGFVDWYYRVYRDFLKELAVSPAPLDDAQTQAPSQHPAAEVVPKHAAAAAKHKTSTKKTSTKKTSTKKTSTKKASTKKTSTKKASTKKASTKEASAKKASAKKASTKAKAR
jgi:hypothetical protein